MRQSAADPDSEQDLEREALARVNVLDLVDRSHPSASDHARGPIASGDQRWEVVVFAHPNRPS
jgi:hypothetical protein